MPGRERGIVGSEKGRRGYIKGHLEFHARNLYFVFLYFKFSELHYIPPSIVFSGELSSISRNKQMTHNRLLAPVRVEVDDAFIFTSVKLHVWRTILCAEIALTVHFWLVLLTMRWTTKIPYTILCHYHQGEGYKLLKIWIVTWWRVKTDCWKWYNIKI